MLNDCKIGLVFNTGSFFLYFRRYEMVVDSDLREVNYEKYCIICKHAECPEHEDPCFECLDNPLNYCTEKPVKWEEKE